MFDTDTQTVLLISAVLMGLRSTYVLVAGWRDASYYITAFLGLGVALVVLCSTYVFTHLPLAACVAVATVGFFVVEGCGWAWYVRQWGGKQQG